MHKRPKGGERKSSDKPKGLRLRKTIRGAEISLNTIQINTKVVKEGSKKFDDLFKTAEAPAE
jgi:ribosomal protein S6E (S10)